MELLVNPQLLDTTSIYKALFVNRTWFKTYKQI